MYLSMGIIFLGIFLLPFKLILRGRDVRAVQFEVKRFPVTPKSV